MSNVKDEINARFLISDTGGGHRASANALKDAMDELVPGGTETEILDIWSEEGCWGLPSAPEVPDL